LSIGIGRLAARCGIADANRVDEKRYVVRADEKLSAFVEMESAIRQGVSILRSVAEIGMAYSAPL
jgi:hypothetical protein